VVSREQVGVRRAPVPGGRPGSELAVVSVDGEDVGRFWLVRHDDVLELSGLELVPAWRSRGVGSVVLRDLVAEARATGLRLELEVEPDNHPARRFYEREGLRRVQGTGSCLRYASTGPGPEAAVRR
jgi:ribosomal protein S18 acetylase RimI-like enzyme